MGNGHISPLLHLWTEWQTDTTENISFPQLRWWVVVGRPIIYNIKPNPYIVFVSYFLTDFVKLSWKSCQELLFLCFYQCHTGGASLFSKLQLIYTGKESFRLGTLKNVHCQNSDSVWLVCIGNSFCKQGLVLGNRLTVASHIISGQV